jgi:hypothetical protein
MVRIMRYVLFCLFVLALSACTDCSKCAHEVYLTEDSLTWNSRQLFTANNILRDLGLKSLEGYALPAYRMMLNSNGYWPAQVIELRQNENGYALVSYLVDKQYDSIQFSSVPLESRTREISEAQWDDFEQKIAESNYWTLPRSNINQYMGGVSILLEGRRPDAVKCNKRAYHLIQRDSPEPGPLRDAIGLLLKYAN